MGKYQKHPRGKSKTQQEFKPVTNINSIMDMVRQKGTAPVNIMKASYGDFSNVGDFQKTLHQVNKAQQLFSLIPAKFREQFNNDPAQLLDFVADPKNRKEGITMGLINPTPEEAEKMQKEADKIEEQHKQQIIDDFKKSAKVESE